MSNHKYTNYVCMAIITVAVLLTVSLYFLKASSAITVTTREQAYVSNLFDTSKVHSINIIMNESDWTTLQENASKEEYVPCSVVIDGDSVKNVAIRAKGNSSLQQVEQSDSERYSFKLEFDHYKEGNLYKGLDKLALNNIIQDSTYMKDYLCYSMMAKMGVETPLCSYISVSVNGEAFGLYLAVESVDDSFAERAYGSDHGLIYKPDSMDMKDGMGGKNGDGNMPQMPGNGGDGNMPQMPGNGGDENMPQMPENGGDGNMPQMPGNGGDGNVPQMSENDDGGNGNMPQLPENMNDDGRNKFGGGMGSNDVALIYTDDEISSYKNIFNGAVFDCKASDKKRLIASIKQLNEGSNLDKVVDVEKVLKYFVVHNFVLNFDSYTGSLMHNYYLYEKNGELSMIPWDYNLAFGAFSMGGGQSSDQGTSMVNFPIDTPVSGATMENRPMLNSLLSNETYMKQYHQYFDEFLQTYWENGSFADEINRVKEMIDPFVQEDKTAFYTYDEFTTGVETLLQFCDLRVQSIRGQLAGDIPATEEGQKDSKSLVDGSSININAMGSNGMGHGKEENQTFKDQTKNQTNDHKENQTFNNQTTEGQPQMPDGMKQEFDSDKMKQLFNSRSISMEVWGMLGVTILCLAGGIVVIKRYGRW